MRILRVISSGYEQGGAENAILLANAMLRSKGHEVITVSSDSRPDLPHFNDFSFKARPNRGLPKVLRATFNFEAYRVLRRVATEFEPDVVTLHTLDQPSAAAIYALRGFTQVLCVHGPEGYTKALLPLYLSSHNYKTSEHFLGGLTRAGLCRYCYFVYVVRPTYMIGIRKYVKGAITYSRYTQQLMAKEGLASHYIPEGVTLQEFRHRLRTPRTVGFAGRLHDHKGVDVLIRAMDLVKRDFPNARLLIAGEGPSERQLQELTTKLRLSKEVIFLGHLDQEQMSSFYEEIDVFVMLSNNAETFGKVGVESLSAGKAVIAPDVGGISDWLRPGENGFFVERSDPNDVARAIGYVFGNPNLLTDMANMCRSVAEMFSMEQYVEKHEEYFRSLLAFRRTAG